MPIEITPAAALQACCAAIGEPAQSPLAVTVNAGAIALPTLAKCGVFYGFFFCCFCASRLLVSSYDGFAQSQPRTLHNRPHLNV